MAFADEVVKDGRGVAVRLDISTENWTSISYRYSTVAGALNGTNDYDPRIIRPGVLRRALGQGGLAAASALEVVLDNTDELADWLLDRTTADCIKARYRLYLVLYDPGESPVTTLTTLMLGEFVSLDFPSRDEATVRLTLADDVFGFLGEAIVTPSLRDWEADGGSTPANCP